VPVREIMNTKWILALTVGLMMAVLPDKSSAEVEWQIQSTLKMDKPPLDMAVSADGNRIFVLTEGGTILVFSHDGKLEDTIRAGRGADHIRVGEREDVLYLQSTVNKTVQIISLEFIHHINIAACPFKGPADALVTIVVFSDFQ
jgi:DNA-binding beta-propeller fold protein YncE